MERYQAGSPQERPALLAEGLQLAEVRRELMQHLIRTNPEQALAAALSVTQLDQLPEPVRERVERPVSGLAENSLFAFDSAAVPAAHSRDLLLKGQLLRAYVFGDLARLTRFEKIPVEGVAIGSEAALIAPALTSSRLASAALSPSQGTLSQTVSFSIDDLNITRQGSYDLITLADCEIPEDTPGAPALPARFVNVLLPAGAQMLQVQVVSSQERLVAERVIPNPIQPPAPRNQTTVEPVSADPKIYAQAALYPAGAGQGDQEQRLRGYCLVPVRLNPLRYLPAEQKLYLAESLLITVTYQQPALQPTTSSTAADDWARQARALAINPNAANAAPTMQEREAQTEPSSQPCDYLIITKASMTNAFAALAQHRAAYNGYRTELLSVEWIESQYDGTRPMGGTDTQTKIRNCIRDYVQNKNTRFVVLGGDNLIVPDRDCYVACGSYVTTNMPTDLYYAGLDGNWDDFDADGSYGEADVGSYFNDEGDLSADVWVGRIPVRTPQQATDYINKVAGFETTRPYFLVKKFAMGGVLLWNSYTNTQRPSDAMNDQHLAFREATHPLVSDAEMWARRTYRDCVQAYGWQASQIGCLFDSLTSWDTSYRAGDYPVSNENLKNRFNEGWNFMIFDTHGGNSSWSAEGSSGSFNANHALAMTGLCLTVYTMACNSGGFDVADPSLSEGFLRCGTGGSLLYFGCSRYGWGSPDAPPAENSSSGGTSPAFMRKFLQVVFQDHCLNSGDAFYRHKSIYASQSGANSSYRWVQFGLNFQGDPAINFVLEKPTVNVSVDNDLLMESSPIPATMTFTRNSTEGTLYIRYSTSGSANPETDFACNPGLTEEGLVVIPAGSYSASIVMQPIADPQTQTDRELHVNLQADQNYLLGSSSYASILLKEDDVDEDGLPDDWEQFYNLDPATPNTTQDSDGDFYSDLDEFIAGTSPVDATSFLTAGSCTFEEPQVLLAIPTLEGRLYTVEWKNSLDASVEWQILAENLQGNGSTITIPDTYNGGQRFFRIKIQLAP